MKKLHLGCGFQILKGWDNIDNVPRTKGIIIHDLTKPLSYAENSVDFIFNEHFIEHLTDGEGFNFLKECFRVGVISEDETKQTLDMIDDRNLTCQTYNEELAEEIANSIPKYYELMNKIIGKTKAW